MSLSQAAKSKNVKEFKVSELSNMIRSVIDDNFGFIKVRGEISGLKVASSGHAYFNLKDEYSVIACTCWRPVFSRIDFKLADGLEVVITGRITTYAPMSRYQINVERIDPAGAGALMELLNRRKEALAKEGLFDSRIKKPLPSFPRKIGVITSPVGAVIKDIIHRVQDRCPTTIMLWPVAVQGEKCAQEVTSAIEGFNGLSKQERPDVIIIARGGGSIEDLWGFNEEIVVRAVVASKIPIISAVGHETDFTLIDFASDVRAPTPTAAAEFALPIISELKEKILLCEARIHSVFTNFINILDSKLSLLASNIKASDRPLYEKQQKLDELSFRLEGSLPANLEIKISKMESIKLPSQALFSLIDKKQTALENNFDNLKVKINNFLQNLYSRWELNTKLIESMSTRQILKRGFAIVRGQKEQIIKSNQQFHKDTNKIIDIEWVDGRSKLTVEQ